jgi:hypothetical protein
VYRQNEMPMNTTGTYRNRMPWLALLAAWGMVLGLGGCSQAPEVGKGPTGPSAGTPGSQPVTIDDTPRAPATVEEAARLLDLRTFPVLEDPKFSGKPTLGGLTYKAKGDTKTALEFQRKHLTERGWKELPDSRFKPEYAQSHFTHDGFIVSVSVSQSDKEPGTVDVSLHNYGNVRPGKLPVAADVKPERGVGPYGGASYVTTAKVADIADACRKLLVDKGWQPYGVDTDEDKIGSDISQEFKWNAILLRVSVSTHKNRPGLTMIHYDTRLLSADLPAPATADLKTLRYDDTNGTLDFDTTDKVDAVGTFYVDTLAKQNWKPTTDPKGQTELSLVFRNPAKDLITLDAKVENDVTQVHLRYFTAKLVEELNRRIEEDKAKRAKDSKKD